MKVYVVVSTYNACDAGEEQKTVDSVYLKEEDAKNFCNNENKKRESVYSTSYEYEEFDCI